MADGGFDPCECIYSHEAAMQRLLTMLRQGQAYCTDTDCTDPPLSNVPGPSPTDPTFMMMALWAALALMLFFMRPASLRSPPANAASEKATAAAGTNNNPPPPPPAL
jgi:hypothetical protein